MLANPQFLEKLLVILDEDPATKSDLVMEYGGSVVELSPGTYRIDRNPYQCTIVIHPEGSRPDTEKLMENVAESDGKVFIDTRCLAMVDRELLDDNDLLEKYQELWFGGQDKACRDLLRDNGGAVRYGFRREGDELGVHSVPDDDLVFLWGQGADPSQSKEDDA